jgi:signal peptidase II
MSSDADQEPPLPAPVEPLLPEGLPLPAHPGHLIDAASVDVGPGVGIGAPPAATVLTVPSFMVPVGAELSAAPYGVPHAPRPPRQRASAAFLVVVTLISLAADLVTKGWAKASLSGFDAKAHGMKKLELWKGHVDFIFAQNPGGAWSFLRSLPDSLRRPFFLVVSAAAIVFIISIYQRVYRDQTSMKWGLPLALGGAMGNLADRIRYGWVVDFIDFSMRWGGREHHWPTFNVADIAIVVGVGLMAIDMLRSRGLHAYDDHAHLRAHEGPDAHTSLPVS